MEAEFGVVNFAAAIRQTLTASSKIVRAPTSD
jgi:hypothetical protein